MNDNQGGGHVADDVLFEAPAGARSASSRLAHAGNMRVSPYKLARVSVACACVLSPNSTP